MTINAQTNIFPEGMASGLHTAAMPTITDGQSNPMQVDNAGRLLVTSEPVLGASGVKAYRAAASGITATTLSYDLFYVGGSATKTVRIKRITVTMSAATAGVYYLQLQRHGAIGTGADTAVTPTPMDVRNVTAATANVQHHTAVSGAPTAALVLGSQRFYLAVSNASVAKIEWDFAKEGMAPLIVSGATDFISVSLNNQTLTSNGTFDYEIDFVEDAS